MDNSIISTKNINKTIIILTIPVIIELLLETVIGYVNVSMLGKLREGFLGATENVNSIIYTCLVFANAFSLGGTVLVSKAIGAQNEERRNKAIGQTITISLILSLLFFMIYSIFARDFLTLMGVKNTRTAPVFDYAMEYMSIMVFSIPITMFRQMFVGILRGMGKTRFPMYLSALNIVLNILFNIFFIYENYTIFGFTINTLGLYLVGAGLATLLTRTISLLILIIYFLKIAKFNITIKDFIFTRNILKEILSVGVPTGIEMLIFRFGMMYYLSMVNSLGPASVDAHAVANAAESISYTPGNAFNFVIVTLVGQFLGAKKYDLARDCIKKTDRMAILFMGFFGILFFVVPFLFTSLFTNNQDVANLANQVLRIEALAQIFFARYYVYSGLMRTIGKSRQIFFVTTGSVWTVRIITTYVLINYTTLGLVGAWIPMFLDYVVRATFLTILANKNLKKIFGGNDNPSTRFCFRKRKTVTAE